jgi:hypothetical protein
MTMDDVRVSIVDHGLAVGVYDPTLLQGEIRASNGVIITDKDKGIVMDGYNVAARNYIWGVSKTYPDIGFSFYEGAPDDIRFHVAGTPASPELKITGDADVHTVAWTDYSGTSTIVGWASYTTKKIFYKRLGHTLYVQFDIDGTSGGANGLIATITLPNTSQNHITTCNVIYGVDNGGSVDAKAENAQNTNVLQFFPNRWGGNWTASGRKWVRGQIVIEL